MLQLTELSSEPLHRQLVRQLRSGILSGRLPSASEMPAVRGLAREHRINAHCVERAYRELETQGLLDSSAGVYRVLEPPPGLRRDLARRRLFERLREQELSLKELELARDIQCRLLPPQQVEGPRFSVTSRNEPARFVAGDFYDVLRHADGSVSVVVADVAGKGLGPSLLMASVKAMLPFLADGCRPEDTLTELNRRLVRELGRREFVALAVAHLDPGSGRLRLANAGLPEPHLLRAGKHPEPLHTPGERLPLGLRRAVSYSSGEVSLGAGDALLMVSDGLPETPTADGEPLGYDAFEELLAGVWSRHTQGSSTDEPWIDELLEGLSSLSDAELADDRTAVVLSLRA